MRPLSFPLLADESVQRAVVTELQKRGIDIQSVGDHGLVGRTDGDVLRRSVETGRVVLTHDSDFGGLAIARGEPVIGIIYLRPGHISAQFVIEIIDAINASALDVEIPFLLVADRRGADIRFRTRTLVRPES